ncbi:hypothetical protein HD806DRAFT_511970 [Xylariaceae sp. AK1471]|nr:hypothetical protein HD806DRAFT_511970 [Xylariaceae sp. AK1471]
MRKFKITLSTGATVTGRCNVPATNASNPNYRYRPLIVGLHGGSYSGEYFDIEERHTASLVSKGLGVPFVALDRACYGDLDDPLSLSVLPIPEGSSYPEEDGALLHRLVLPAIWTEFGHDCTCMTLLCHSLGTPGAIIAAGLHARDQQANGERRATYPLAGLMFSGWGSQAVDNPLLARTEVHGVHKTHVVTDAEAKLGVMLPPWATEHSVRKYAVSLNRPVPIEELKAIDEIWLPRWRSEWAPAVKVPVMVGVAEREALWLGTEDHVKDLAGCFYNSPRVDGSLISGAPHNIEMSYWSQGWFARCFGFALECAASQSQPSQSSI